MSAHKASAYHDYQFGELVPGKLYQDYAGTAIYEFQKKGRKLFHFTRRDVDKPKMPLTRRLALTQLISLVPIDDQDIRRVHGRTKVTLHNYCEYSETP